MEPPIIIELLGEKFPGEVLASGESLGQSWVSLKRDRLADICKYLKTTPEIKMDYLIDVTAVDWLPRTPRFEVVYHMRSIKHGSSLRLKVPVEEDDPRVPTVTGVWLTANWHERETFDLMGIIFEGHPDPRRILMPDDWEGHPLRKDYPLGGYDWEFKPW